MRCVFNETLRAASTVWKTKPITLYCKNQAVMDAGPTVRYGASNPSFVAIFQAWPSWFLPLLTKDELAIMATFSKGMVQYRTTTAYTPSPTERYAVWQGVTRFSGSAIVVLPRAAVSETALAARALATELSLGFARQPERLTRGGRCRRACARVIQLRASLSMRNGAVSAAVLGLKMGLG